MMANIIRLHWAMHAWFYGMYTCPSAIALTGQCWHGHSTCPTVYMYPTYVFKFNWIHLNLLECINLADHTVIINTLAHRKRVGTASYIIWDILGSWPSPIWYCTCAPSSDSVLSISLIAVTAVSTFSSVLMHTAQFVYVRTYICAMKPFTLYIENSYVINCLWQP